MGQFLVFWDTAWHEDAMIDLQVFDDADEVKEHCKKLYNQDNYWYPTVYEIQGNQLVNASDAWGLRWHE